MKSLYSLILILISLTYAFAGDVYVVKVDTSLNIRKSGSTNSAIVGSLKNGQYIYATSVANGWAKFYKGYASTKYLSKVSGSANYKTNANLNFRNGPSTSHGIIVTLKKGTSVTLFGKDPFNSAWAVTNRGYASAKYLDKIGGNSSPSNPSSSQDGSVKSLVTSLLIYEEGVGPNGLCDAYIDSLGYPTIGYGKLCKKQAVKTLAQARSLCSSYINGCTAAKARQWLSDEVDSKTSECIKSYTNIRNAYNKASNKRKAIILSMAYQMGCPSLSGFKEDLKLMADGKWAAASVEMLNSRWARQTPNRAKRHSYVIKNDSCGDFCKQYGW